MLKGTLIFGAGVAVGYAIRAHGDEFRNDPEIQKALKDMREAFDNLRTSVSDAADAAADDVKDIVEDDKPDGPLKIQDPPLDPPSEP